MHTLTHPQRRFFKRVNEAAFANPFGQQRDHLDRELAALGKAAITRGRGASRGEILERLLIRVRAELKSLGPIRIDRLSSDDRFVVSLALLFDVFHRVVPDFDALIETQIQAKSKRVDVPFGAAVLSELRGYGFTDQESVRYFSMLYQMRRAFRFIDSSLVGTSDCMRSLRERIWSNIFTSDIYLYEGRLWDRMEDFSLFLVGETGAGKTVTAGALGRSGWIDYDPSRSCFAHSFTESFVPINLSQYPETLIESELFGHKKGAFTGASSDHLGVLGQCQPHGTIFLDEIGDTSAAVQIKLLQVLQAREFTPVGSREVHRFEGRVVAATHRPIDELRREGKFRDDFYYRLCSDVVTIPPLRTRIREAPTELPLLLEHIVGRIGAERGQGGPDVRKDEIVERCLEAIGRDLPSEYKWPGNVRELEQCVRRVILTGAYYGDQLYAGHQRTASSPLGRRIDEGQIDARTLVAEYCAQLYDSLGSYEKVARRTGLDRRTVKKHVLAVYDER